MTLPATEPAFKSFTDSYKATMALHNAEATTPTKVDVDPAVSMLPVKAVGSGISTDFGRPSMPNASQPKQTKSKQASSQQDSELTNLTQYPPLKNLNITLMETKKGGALSPLESEDLAYMGVQRQRDHHATENSNQAVLADRRRTSLSWPSR
jgi:hypothetical protein